MDPRLAFTRFAGRYVHLGICGSISAYKAIELMRLYQRLDMRVSVTLTQAAQHFVTPLTFTSLHAEAVYTSMFGGSETGDADPFGHLTPGGEADVFVIAPASATTLARLATGSAEEILSAQCLAFPGPVVIAPAMNPRMWQHPATQHNACTLQNRGAAIVTPASGLVACGDEGQGKLADIHAILLATLKALSPQDMAGKKVMLTLGPTREQWDGVRFWTNPSSGLMGSSLALAAWLRGAEVHAVSGPGVAPLPVGIYQYPVVSAREMYAQAKALWPGMDMGLFTAAVADFSPQPFGAQKFKKQGNAAGFQIEFTANPDILAELSASKSPHQRVLGFAAETDQLEEHVKTKLHKKHAHIIAGNIVGASHSGFGVPTNTMYVLDAAGKAEHWQPASKPDVAWRLLDWLLTL